MTKNIIELEKLSKKFGQFEALEEIDLTLAPAEILGFIGPNGAGKSTTIRIILGLLKGEGSAKVFGLDAWKDAVEIHKNLAYVPGDVALWPQLTGGEVIDFFLKVRGQEKTNRKKELIEKFDLDPSKKCKTYSKGNRQKVALIAALSADVDLYIFDEPTAGLDPLMESYFQEEVRRIATEGKAILLSSHILSEVEKLCDTISIIKEGRIIESGKLADMRHLTRSKVKVKTRKPLGDLTQLPYVHDPVIEDDLITFGVDGDRLGEAMAQISQHDILLLETQPPTLEDLFMSHYEKEVSHES